MFQQLLPSSGAARNMQPSSVHVLLWIHTNKAVWGRNKPLTSNHVMCHDSNDGNVIVRSHSSRCPNLKDTISHITSSTVTQPNATTQPNAATQAHSSWAILQMEAASSSETLAYTYWSTWRRIQEDWKSTKTPLYQSQVSQPKLT